VVEPATADVVPAKPARKEQPIERGTLVGRYFVLDAIGTGGLGQVYAAFDPELDRKVAIKLLRPAVRAAADADVLQVRLLREAQSMAKLSHPNVVTVYDVGTIDDRVFITMELLDGLTLRQWVRKHEPNWAAIRDVMLQAGEGIVAAHAAGLIHRDFKPGNVIVCKDGRVRVLDFGIALAVGDGGPSGEEPTAVHDLEDLTADAEGGGAGESLTRTGMFMGTPGYMPPEQYERRAELDARADQFAFCVTLFEMLYRQRPFAGRDAKAVLAAMRAGELAAIPRGADVPGWLPKVIRRGLELDPARRWPDMVTLLRELKHDERVRRQRGWVTMAAAFVGGLGFWGVDALRATPAETDPVVDQLVVAARAAAARSYFVYPPSEDPEADTAYARVLELERLDGPHDPAGDARGAELRKEFSETLVRLGDHYWARDGGAAFAVDYYAQALIFDREHATARERAALTPGELAMLRSKADERSFSAAELEAADSLAALATQDDAVRQDRVAALYRRRRRPAVTTQRELEALLGAAMPAVEPVAPRAGRLPPPRPAQAAAEAVDPAAPSSGGTAQAPPAAAPPTTPKAGRTDPGNRPPTASQRDPGRAAAEANAGAAAFASGNLADAEAAYHRALEADGRNLRALSGLAELFFERGDYGKAARFGARALGVEPKDGQLHILLGDSYFKLLRYDDARAEYEAAKALGHALAGGRLARLAKTLGQ
jgi:tetratricopeptide (TPR) repeat protein